MVENVPDEVMPVGAWPNEYKYPAKEFFAMVGVSNKPSRWNTLRAMRVLKWWESS